MYWAVAELIAHYSVNSCQLHHATCSGRAPHPVPSWLVRQHAGDYRLRKYPVKLASGEMRKFLKHGDEIIHRIRCVRDGVTSIGLGECHGRITASN